MIEACGSALLIVLLALHVHPRPPTRRPGGLPPAQHNQPMNSVRRLQRRRPKPPEITPMEVAEWCDLLSAELRTGATLTHAVRTAAPPASLCDTVAAITLRLDRGEPLQQAVRVASAPHVDVATVALAACAGHGGPAAQPLDRAAATLRARAADLGERHTQSAQARMSALVMTVLPIAMLALVTATSASTRDVLASPIGAGVLTVGASLNFIGWRWMRRIIGAAS